MCRKVHAEIMVFRYLLFTLCTQDFSQMPFSLFSPSFFISPSLPFHLDLHARSSMTSHEWQSRVAYRSRHSFSTYHIFPFFFSIEKPTLHACRWHLHVFSDCWQLHISCMIIYASKKLQWTSIVKATKILITDLLSTALMSGYFAKKCL